MEQILDLLAARADNSRWVNSNLDIARVGPSPPALHAPTKQDVTRNAGDGEQWKHVDECLKGVGEQQGSNQRAGEAAADLQETHEGARRASAVARIRKRAGRRARH